MSKRVVGIGHAQIEHLATVDRYPEAFSKNNLTRFSIQGGGTIATALAALANFGAEAAFVGKISDDDFGRFIRQGLAAVGVDLSHLIIQPHRISPYSFILIDNESKRPTIFQTIGNVDPLLPEEIKSDFLKSTSILLVDGNQSHIDLQIQTAEKARQRGITVVLNAGELNEGMGELIALADAIIASERFASELAPRGELEDSLIEISRMGPPSVIITLGPEGSIGLEGDKLVRQPPLNVTVEDSSGAGDVFLAGYVYGLLQSWPLERCMQIASAAAGLSCRVLGPRAALPMLEEVEAVSWQEMHT